MIIDDYKVIDFDKFNYMSLYNFDFISQSRSGRKTEYYEKIVTFDTETAVLNGIPVVTDWTLCIEDLICIYGHHIEDAINLFSKISDTLQCSEHKRIKIYVHNYPYDYMFLRNHLLENFKEPANYLAVKSHKYVTMLFSNGIEFRDSYILTQRSLEKLCEDTRTLSKAAGTWDYNKLRTPDSPRSYQECVYAATDTIALCKALRVYMSQRGYNNGNCPLTNTGFIRNKARSLSRKWKHSNHKWNYYFKSMALDTEQYRLLEEAYHGGYTHANRYYVNRQINSYDIAWTLRSKDFRSSYPSVLLYEKYPMSAFQKSDEYTLDDILDLKDDYAFVGYILLRNVHCKKNCPMPSMAFHKAKVCLDYVLDNGKILDTSYVIYPFTDPDLNDILECYEFDEEPEVASVQWATKDYLPSWITDFIMELYENKTKLKGIDEALYMISKFELNGIYGMSVQKIIRDILEEDWESGIWEKNTNKTDEEWLDKFYANKQSFLPYQWGVWCTAYAQANLFQLGKCCKFWIYSDTDSVKGYQWDDIKLREYNQSIIQKSIDRDIGTVEHKGNKITIGIADDDGEMTEFKTMGSKRYAYRDIDGSLHLTVAGVPKKEGLQCIHGTLREFKKGKIFKNEGFTKWKMRPEYVINQGINFMIYEGSRIEYGSGIILEETEYELDHTIPYDIETGLPLEIEVEVI